MSAATAQLRHTAVAGPGLESARGQARGIARHLGLAALVVLVLAWSVVAYSSLVFGLYRAGAHAATQHQPGTTLVNHGTGSTGP
jgi:hypothetical protein